MAALIPAIGTCVSRMTGGERRLANRLEQKLEDDWLLWTRENLAWLLSPAGSDHIASQLKEAHKTGTPRSDMAVIYRDYNIGKPVEKPASR